MSELRELLDRIRRAPATAQPPAQPAELRSLPGQVHRVGEHSCWRIVTPIESSAGVPRRGMSESVVGPDLHRGMLLDLETGGFAGTPVFLIGVIDLGAAQPSVEQFLLRDYPEEHGILASLASLAAARDTWVTFNGKSFDEPVLRDRCTLHRIPLRSPNVHVDLLHAARRRWGGTLPDCRLATLESAVLGRMRVGDVPGRDVPDLFHHFVRTGNARVIAGVIQHNAADLLAMLDLLRILGAEAVS